MYLEIKVTFSKNKIYNLASFALWYYFYISYDNYKGCGCFWVNSKSHFKTNLDIRKKLSSEVHCTQKISHHTNTYETYAVISKN